MNNERYKELKNQLEYFYLIPVDQIVNAITKEISNCKNPDSEFILNTVFKHVFKGATYYYDFIVTNINHTFFNENYGDGLRIGLCQLIYLSLQNNCILNAFFTVLAQESKPDKLSASNVPVINAYITDWIYRDQHFKKSKQLIGEVDSQFFYNRKKIFQRDFNQNIYPNTIIDALSQSKDQIENTSIEMLQYILPAACFLFMKKDSSKFGHLIKENAPLLDKYNILSEECQNYQDKYFLPIDKLIFQSEMEAIFGFSFFSSICPILDEIHNLTISDTKGLKDLEGQSFINIISQIANLPLFFGKELFFRYICYSFLNSHNIDFSYFEESAKEIAIRMPSSLPKILQINNGLLLMDRFCKILSSISLPVLFSLWETIIHELEQKELFKKSILDIYKLYLTKNIRTLTYNAYDLTENEIQTLSNTCLRQNICFDNNYLHHHIHTPKISDIYTTKSISLRKKSSSSYLRETMQQLICDYCNIDSLKKHRFPLFFLSDKDLDKYSPLSHTITSLQYDPECFHNEDHYRISTFFINHRKILFEYLFSK